MGRAWQWAVACGWGSLMTRGLGNPLESLNRERWVSLDSTDTDQTTDVATGAAGSMVYISGYKQRAPTGADGSQSIEALLTAYNSSGVRQWVAEYGSSGEDLGNSVAADATGVYLAGTESVLRNSSSGSSSSGGGGDTDDTDAFVVKYNSTGGEMWKASWGTSEPDLGNGVAVDGESGLVYVVGTTRGSMSSDDAGYGEGGGEPDGEMSAGSVDAAAAGGNTIGSNAGVSDVFLTCLSAADGVIQWTRQFGSSAMDVGNRVAVGPRGGVFLVGQLGDDKDSSLAGPRAFLAKYDYLGNAQFTARLNSSSTHYAVDLAPSVGSGGEGVVYMSGYTLGDNPSVFLARFEGSTGTQTWLSHLGEETGMPHLAQSVAVVEGSKDGFSLAAGDAVEGTVAGSDAGAGTPVVEGQEAAAGDDARIVVVGYNTSVASAGSHSSTGFTAAADTNGNWAWYSASGKADRQTAIAIGAGGLPGQVGGAGGESFAYIVGTVAASEASPGNYLFLDIQRVVRAGSYTPAPVADATGQEVDPDTMAEPAGGASSTTGLSQGSSLWLLIIAPIFVVLSCILMVSYVSKQCAIAFGTRPPPREPLGPIEFGDDGDGGRSGGRSGRGGGVRTARAFRRGKTDWHDRASGSPNSGSADRRRRRDSGGDSGSAGKGARVAAWPRSVAAAFRDRGSPYRELGTREHGREGSDEGGGREEQRGSSATSSPLSLENGEVELRQVTAQQGHVPFDYPREENPGRGTVLDDHSHGRSSSATDAAAGWDSFEDEDIPMGGSGHGGQSRVTGNSRGDEPPAAEVLPHSDQAHFARFPPPAQEPQQLL